MLVFRNQTSYERFWTGRNYLTQICTSVRNLTRGILCSSQTPSVIPAATDRAQTERVVRILIALLYSVKNHLRAEWGAATASTRPQPLGLRSQTCEYSNLLPEGLRVFEEHGLGLPLELTFFVERYIGKATEKGWFNAPQASQLQAQLNALVDAYGRMETIRLTPLPIAHLYA